MFKIKLFLFFNLFIIIITINKASYCGQSAIPFSLEIKENNQPILGCSMPSCFGWSLNKKELIYDPAQFYKIWGQSDGFIKSISNNNFQQKTFSEFSKCDKSFTRSHCSKNSWVGGIAPSTFITPNYPIKLICCSYNKLNNSVFSGNAQIRAGQMILGGEILNKNGQQIGFEYISNIWRIFDKKGVLYIAEVRKFDCFSQINNKKILLFNKNIKIDNNNNIKEIKELNKLNEEKEKEILEDFSEYEMDLKDLLLTNNNTQKSKIFLNKINSTTKSTISSQSHLHIGPRKRKIKLLKSDKIVELRRKQQNWNDNKYIQDIKWKYQNSRPMLKPSILSVSPFGGYYKVQQKQ